MGAPQIGDAALRAQAAAGQDADAVADLFGQFEAVVWANQRDGSTRVTKVWHAPALGYLPVQAMQYRKGQPEVQMRLLSLER